MYRSVYYVINIHTILTRLPRIKSKQFQIYYKTCRWLENRFNTPKNIVLYRGLL